MLFKIALASTAADFGHSQTFNVFEIVLVGFSFVFLILLILSLMTSILGKFFARISVEKPSSPFVEVATASGKPPASSKEIENNFAIEESDPRYIAVVAAAIHCVMDGRKHRIISIRSSNSGWAAEGRRQIFSSHKVR